MASAQRRTGWTLGLVVVLLVAVVTALAAGRHYSTARGATTAQVAATLFVNAVNNGQGDGAAAIACNGFADGARSAARSGADPGISYRLGEVTVNGSSATAQFTQVFDVGGAPQESVHLLTLTKSSGLWLVCGQT